MHYQAPLAVIQKTNVEMNRDREEKETSRLSMYLYSIVQNADKM